MGRNKFTVSNVALHWKIRGQSVLLIPPVQCLGLSTLLCRGAQLGVGLPIPPLLLKGFSLPVLPYASIPACWVLTHEPEQTASEGCSRGATLGTGITQDGFWSEGKKAMMEVLLQTRTQSGSLLPQALPPTKLVVLLSLFILASCTFLPCQCTRPWLASLLSSRPLPLPRYSPRREICPSGIMPIAQPALQGAGRPEGTTTVTAIYVGEAEAVSQAKREEKDNGAEFPTIYTD